MAGNFSRHDAMSENAGLLVTVDAKSAVLRRQTAGEARRGAMGRRIGADASPGSVRSDIHPARDFDALSVDPAVVL
ncbi:MAG: hypothetical protein E5X80_08820 [Mesorhizobium sp.]|nr:MAG: hypothetical protein E5X78_17930 [Mesorhizobium sp.]TIO59114.1 MAG: hypothetical protein E5X79_17750 [Mesorhizobium sp.]TJV65699.1 MAG: hypothetical protein E5X80_08820 [Mesorhizobium sp.]